VNTNRLVSYISGLLFAAGLVIGGMTQPEKVVDFLNVAGDWDPSLAFVMGGALLVNVIAYRWTNSASRPILSDQFYIPTRSDLDWKLITGGALFGIGWGLGGYCPGPGLTAVLSFQTPAVAFVGGLTGGVLLYNLFEKLVLESDATLSNVDGIEAGADTN
jgi:uncharacterized membrane protein YedE/YeeE